MKAILIACIVCSSLNVFSQSCTTTDSLFGTYKNELLLDLFNDGNTVKYEIETSVAYYKLLVNSDIACLLPYLQDTLAPIRVGIFEGLYMLGISDSLLKNLYQLHKNDTVSFLSQNVDVVYEKSLKSAMDHAFDRKAYGLATINRDTLSRRLSWMEKKLEEEILYKILPGYHHNRISKTDLLKLDSLNFHIPDIQIISYDIVTASSDTTYRNVRRLNTLNRFTPAIKAWFQSLEPNDILLFENIKARYQQGKVRTINTIYVRIK
jgi:hypothetical protein